MMTTTNKEMGVDPVVVTAAVIPDVTAIITMITIGRSAATSAEAQNPGMVTCSAMVRYAASTL